MQGIFYDRPEKYKYSMAFTSKINPIVSAETDKYLALASQDKFKKFLPKDINFDEKVDFLGVCGEAFLANRLNLNDDGVKTEEALKIADLFPLSFIDANHSRKDIIGVVIQASFAEFGTGKELTREEASKLTSPFSVILSGIVWKIANARLADAIEQSSDPSSEWYNKLFYSWELVFSESELILIDAQKTNFEDGEIIKDPKKIGELEGKLRAYGGKGVDGNGKKIGRIAIGDVLPLGLGIVEDPAGQVQPITTNQSQASISDLITELARIDNQFTISSKELAEALKRVGVTSSETVISLSQLGDITSAIANIRQSQTSIAQEDAKDYIEFSLDFPIELTANKEEADIILTKEDFLDIKDNKDLTKESIEKAIASYNLKVCDENKSRVLKAYLDIKIENNSDSISQSNNSNVTISDNIKKFMKINKFEDLTDENLKECHASDLREVYNTKITEISKEWDAKNKEQENATQAAKQSATEFENKYKELETKYQEMEKNLNKIVSEAAQKEKVEKFSARMSTIADKYELTEKQNNIVAEELKAIDKDEDFTKYVEKADLFFTKKGQATQIIASTVVPAANSQQTVDNALKAAAVAPATIPNASDATTQTLADKSKAAFGLDGWTVDAPKKVKK